MTKKQFFPLMTIITGGYPFIYFGDKHEQFVDTVAFKINSFTLKSNEDKKKITSIIQLNSAASRP